MVINRRDRVKFWYKRNADLLVGKLAVFIVSWFMALLFNAMLMYKDYDHTPVWYYYVWLWPLLIPLIHVVVRTVYWFFFVWD